MAIACFWTGMLVLSLLCAAALGTTGETAAALMTGAQEGIRLGIALAGPLCLWSGACRVMEAAGLTRRLSRWMRPLLRRLLPGAGEAAREAAAANVTANLLGLGNAATPLGIEAVRRMQAERPASRRDTAGDDLCRFVVLNTASIQLLPTTVAAVRAAAGAAAPFDILPAVWLTSGCALAAGLGAARLLGALWRRRGL